MTQFLFAIAVFLLGGACSILAGRRRRLVAWCGAGGAVAGSLLGASAAIDALLAPAPLALAGHWEVPAGSFSLLLDPLAAFFLIPLFLLAPLCALYGCDYLKSNPRNLGPHWFFFNLTVASMAMVATAANSVLFLAAWEVMTIGSFFLVSFDHHERSVSEAAWLYLVIAHLGVLCLFALFLFAGSQVGSSDFSSFTGLAGLSAGPAALCFFLALFGFGAKAGLFPLHIWLPDAHPAAPSHVSALMSGVLVKMGIYGILRIWSFLPSGYAWWGGVLMILGISGALYAIVMAAMQRDIKRCLAYSTIENIGLIFLALGLGIFASGRGMPGLALTAFAAALLHIWNHALFKGMLFLGAGSLLHGTGTRDLDRMGGLLKRMPVTGTLMIGGSLAICALPPLNGFVSEWLIYLGLLQAGLHETGVAALFPLFIAGMLALTGGVAVIVFTRLTGIALLGVPRTAQAAGAHESGKLMTVPMAVLLALCLGIGLFPGRVLSLVRFPAAILLPGSRTAEIGHEALGSVANLGRWGGILIVLILLCWWGLRLVRAGRRIAHASTWGCGYRAPTVRMGYTAEAYAEQIQQLLPRWMKPAISGGSPRGLFPIGDPLVQREPHPLYLGFYLPLSRKIADRLQRLRWLQQGRLHTYIFYMFLTCALLLVWSVLAERALIW